MKSRTKEKLGLNGELAETTIADAHIYLWVISAFLKCQTIYFVSPKKENIQLSHFSVRNY